MLKIIRNIKNGQEKFLKIKNDEKKYQKTISYGIKSLIFAILIFLSCLSGSYTTQLVMDIFDESFLSIFLIVPWVISMTIAYLGPIVFFILAIVNSLRQIRLKKKLLGVLSLILTFIAIFIVITFYYLIHFK